MEDRESKLRAELAELDQQLQDPSVFSDPKYPKLAKRRSELEEIIELYDTRAKLLKSKQASQELLQSEDQELRQMAEEDIAFIEELYQANELKLADALTPQDPNNNRDVIIEIRAAAGGDESSLFAGELYRPRCRWPQRTQSLLCDTARRERSGVLVV